MPTQPSKDDVVVVRDGRVVIIKSKVWNIIMGCAGQMINDGDLYDYYRGFVPRRTLDAAVHAYKRIK